MQDTGIVAVQNFKDALSAFDNRQLDVELVPANFILNNSYELYKTDQIIQILTGKNKTVESLKQGEDLFFLVGAENLAIKFRKPMDIVYNGEQ